MNRRDGAVQLVHTVCGRLIDVFAEILAHQRQANHAQQLVLREAQRPAAIGRLITLVEDERVRVGDRVQEVVEDMWTGAFQDGTSFGKRDPPRGISLDSGAESSQSQALDWTTGVYWIYGHGGIGKSFLMA